MEEEELLNEMSVRDGIPNQPAFPRSHSGNCLKPSALNKHARQKSFKQEAAESWEEKQQAILILAGTMTSAYI